MEHVFWKSFLLGLVIHLVTAMLLGKKADGLPGGAFGVALMTKPWWLSMLAALAGHVCGVLLRRALVAAAASRDQNENSL